MDKLVFDEAVCLLGGGEVPSNLPHVLPDGPLICADSGADYALLAGREPVAIFGDMDSINPTVRARFADIVHLVEDQNSTDFEKCLMRIEAPFIYGFGFLGRRMDHTIASLSTLAKFATPPIALIGDGDVTLCLNGSARFEVEPDMDIGLLPWPIAACTSKGLKWELDGLDLQLGGQISSSNKAVGELVEVTVLSGTVLVTLPLRNLERLPSAFGLSLGS
ncbi:MAG: thiamine diphosphokinase [Pseudomonadota bacterium]